MHIHEDESLGEGNDETIHTIQQLITSNPTYERSYKNCFLINITPE